MSVAKNLRLLRRIRGLTLEDLSEKVGISVSYLSRIESGNRRVTEPLLFKLSELLECDPTEILSNEPPEKQIASLGFSSFSLHSKPAPEKLSELMGLLEKVAGQLDSSVQLTKKIPLFTSHYFKNTLLPVADTVLNSEPVEGIPLTEPSDWVECPPELLDVKTAFAYCVVNEEMSPRYNPGDTVFVNPHKPLMPGCFVLTITQDGGPKLRQFVTSDGDTFEFQSLGSNPVSERLPIDQIKAVYRVVGARETA